MMRSYTFDTFAIVTVFVIVVVDVDVRVAVIGSLIIAQVAVTRFLMRKRDPWNRYRWDLPLN